MSKKKNTLNLLGIQPKLVNQFGGVLHTGVFLTINAPAIMKVQEVIFFMHAKHFIG